MKCKEEEYTYKSVSGIADIYAKCYAPENPAEVKGVMQIAHGMAEYGKRYETFARYLNTRGYAVFINDHLGHGKSVAKEEDLGYFGEKDGPATLVEDAKNLTEIAKSEYPDVPFVLFGHSMGSFIARSYASFYPEELDALVLCGTAGPNPAAAAGAFLANLIAKTKDSHYRSPFIDNLAFGSYNKRYKPNRTKFDWLTRDYVIVDAYVDDPLCGFLFTATGYRDMFNLLQYVSSENWYEKMPKDLPVFFIAGTNDPVGAYGKGVKTVADSLAHHGNPQVGFKLYRDCRHELLNEMNRLDVFADIADWCDNATQSSLLK